MARPIKVGLDYFSLDVNLDDSIELVEAEHGLEGYAIILKLWQRIYSEGYYINWEKDNIMLFSRRINSEETLVNDVVNSCFNRGIFSKVLYEKYHVLTSKGIQKRYLTACKQIRRSNIPFHKELILVNNDFSSFITEETSIIPEETLVSSGEHHSESTQRKGKEKKGNRKERKEETPELPPDDLTLQQLSNLWTDCGYGMLNNNTVEKLIADVEIYSLPWVTEAIQIGNIRNKRSYAYVRGILNKWQTDGKEESNELGRKNTGDIEKPRRKYGRQRTEEELDAIDVNDPSII